MVKQKNVCVIGAGVAGLVAAKTFGARGHKVTILERSGDIGGVWEPARSYPEVQTQSPKDLYRYTDKPMPDSYPEWPKGPQVHAYLADYAKDHDLTERTRLNTAVVGMARRNSGLPAGRWKSGIRMAASPPRNLTLSRSAPASSMNAKRSATPVKKPSKRQAV